MMGWWSSANTALDEQIEQATSSSLENLELAIEISDTIRSKSVQPKEAMRSLKRRIDNKNPNVQLSALKLTDICIKNGGSHFLVEIASREFMDNLKSHLLAEGPARARPEVASKMLEYIQLWTVATEGRYELGYIQTTYDFLKKAGFAFPPKTRISKSMIDTSAPPEWTDSDVCMRCRTAFSFTNRKHHCRNCGNVFDQQCSSKTMSLPHLGIDEEVRVDDGCYDRLMAKKGPTQQEDRSPTYPHKTHSTSTMHPRSARVDTDDDFDEDLKKALAMSLDEVRAYSNGYAEPRINTTQTQPQSDYAAAHQTYAPVETSGRSQPAPTSTEEDEDEDLKQAIAASLRDVQQQQKKPTSYQGITSSYVPVSTQEPAPAPAPAVAPRQDHELTPIEAENISLFATLVERLQTQPAGTVLREPQIQELYDSISALRPKLARSYGDTMSKHDTLIDLHGKLTTVVRMYDRMLEDRLTSAYGQHGISGYPQPAAPRAYMASQPAPRGIGESFYSPNASQPVQTYQQPSQAGYSPAPQQAAVAQSPYPPQVAPVQSPYPQQAAPVQSPYVQHSHVAQPQYAPQASTPGAPSQPPTMTTQAVPVPQINSTSAAAFYSTQPVSSPPVEPSSLPPATAATAYPAPATQAATYVNSPQLQEQAAPYASPSAPPPLEAQTVTTGAPAATQAPAPAQWQQQQSHQQHAPQQVPNAPVAYPSYGADAFPSAPQHVPQHTGPIAASAPAEEEILIEL